MICCKLAIFPKKNSALESLVGGLNGVHAVFSQTRYFQVTTDLSGANEGKISEQVLHTMFEVNQMCRR